MRGREPRRHVSQIRDHELRRVVARIASRKKDRVEPGQIAKEGIDLLEFMRAPRLVPEVELRGYPQPVVEIVARADFTDPTVHDGTRQREHRAWPAVLVRDALDAVVAEER